MKYAARSRSSFAGKTRWCVVALIGVAAGSGWAHRLAAAPPENHSDTIVLANEDSNEPYKSPFTRLLELPGRAVRGVGNAVSSTGNWAGEKLDGARAIRDEIYRDGWQKFADQRMQQLGRGVMDGVEGVVGTAGDLAHGRAERVSRDPDHADDAWKARAAAVEKAKQGLDSLSKKVDPVIAPTRKATEITSNPNRFDQTKALASWIDASARTMAQTLLKSATKATEKDLQERVKQQLREKIQHLSYDQQRLALALVDKSVAQAVKTTLNAAGSAVGRVVDGPPAKPAGPAANGPATPHVLLSGASNWDAGNGNQACTIAGTIDVTAQKFTGKAMNGIFRQVSGQTFTGEFQGEYSGNATQGTLRGGGTVTTRWRDGKTGSPKASSYRYDLQAGLSGGVVTGFLSAKGKNLYSFSLPVR